MEGIRLSEATWEPESHLANAPNILVDYLHHAKTSERSMQNRGVDIITEGAGEDLPWPKCIRMGSA